MEDYMYLQQMRFGDRITYRKDCSVDADKVIVPAFTFQPLVENAIIHGLSKKKKVGTCPGTYLAERWIYVNYHWG